MSKQTYGLTKETMDKWRKGLKKKDPITWSPSPVVINPGPVKPATCPPPPIPAGQSNDLAKAFESLFSDPDPNRIIKYDKDIWKVNFPKMAEDLLDIKEFKVNVLNSVLTFIRINFPLDLEVAKDVRMQVECIDVENDEYGHYPKITFKPSFEGGAAKVEEFLKPFHQWSGHEMYWKGSFLKSKTSGKITGMRLTGLAYNVPDRLMNGQPISYVEKTVI